MMNMEKESIKERMVLHEWINERIMNTMKMNEHDQGLFQDFFFLCGGGGSLERAGYVAAVRQRPRIERVFKIIFLGGTHGMRRVLSSVV